MCSLFACLFYVYLFIYSFLLFIYFIVYFNIILLFIYHVDGIVTCVKPKSRLEEKIISLSKGSSCLDHLGSHPVGSLMTITPRVDQFKGFAIRRLPFLHDETLNLVHDSRDLF